MKDVRRDRAGYVRHLESRHPRIPKNFRADVVNCHQVALKNARGLTWSTTEF